MRINLKKQKTKINTTLAISGLGINAKEKLNEALTYMGLSIPNKDAAIKSLKQAKKNPLN